MQVLAKAANGAAIGSPLAASSYLLRMHSEKGDSLKFFKKGNEKSVLGRLEALRNYLQKHREWKPSENIGPLEGHKIYLYPIIRSPYGKPLYDGIMYHYRKA
jgi:hypothetical protein